MVKLRFGSNFYFSEAKWKLVSETVQGIITDYRMQCNNAEKEVQNKSDGSPIISASNSAKLIASR